MRFHKINLLFMFSFVFGGPHVVLAGTCQCGWYNNLCTTGQHCVVYQGEWDPDAQMFEEDYICDPCPEGYGHSETNCYQCVVLAPTDNCSGYTDCPSGLKYYGVAASSQIKCKAISNACPSGSNCTKYNLCNTSTGPLSNKYAVTNTCHLEGTNKTCYPNIRPCKDFEPSFHSTPDIWKCPKANQTGNAEWDTDEDEDYNTSNCRCEFEMPISQIGCIQAVAKYKVHSSDQWATDNAAYPVYYIPEYRYCKKCSVGHLPQQSSVKQTINYHSSTYVIYYVPSDHQNNVWGTTQCTVTVQAPYYADGCVIDFSKSNFSQALAACQKTCPVGQTITENGATSADMCEYNESTSYEDDTGIFTVSGATCAGSGG